MTASVSTARETVERNLRDDAKLAALEQRVYGLERGVHDLNQLFTGRIGEVSAQLAGLSTKLDERSRTPWATIVSAMGVVLAIVLAGGQLAKAPVDDALARLERDYDRLARQTVAGESFAEFKANLSERRLAQDAAAASLQRQLDELKGAAGGVYGARDVIIELRDRLRRIERARPPPGG